MTPRTEVSVCEREPIGERKKKLLGSEIVTELEVSQFFWGKWKTAHGFVGSERCLDGLVQRSSGASGRPNGAEIRGAENDTSGDDAQKKGGQRPRLFWWEKVDAPPRWHCQDGRRVGCIVDGQRAGGDRSAEPWALGQ